MYELCEADTDQNKIRRPTVLVYTHKTKFNRYPSTSLKMKHADGST